MSRFLQLFKRDAVSTFCICAALSVWFVLQCIHLKAFSLTDTSSRQFAGLATGAIAALSLLAISYRSSNTSVQLVNSLVDAAAKHLFNSPEDSERAAVCRIFSRMLQQEIPFRWLIHVIVLISVLTTINWISVVSSPKLLLTVVVITLLHISAVLTIEAANLGGVPEMGPSDRSIAFTTGFCLMTGCFLLLPHMTNFGLPLSSCSAYVLGMALVIATIGLPVYAVGSIIPGMILTSSPTGFWVKQPAKSSATLSQQLHIARQVHLQKAAGCVLYLPVLMLQHILAEATARYLKESASDPSECKHLS